ncbi:Citrate synthase [Taphrina deformans PYCC 5710]|uniref:Citrate synthase n=1 Tax=Taphrina deformans (strain PYCC 5710 / ATCC 11124 / CBS 356.35 / IMI 108563 / JCM 9778 / NBRC 8474) TaxID=1097556 RepID=R4XFV8_TAPDE|nr:Citrate synthase [Taphrina deformans PYCC 5710]|eukprot:CCG83379.1 Citrate synthase [Taphrina deformans PYCC 5710]
MSSRILLKSRLPVKLGHSSVRHSSSELKSALATAIPERRELYKKVKAKADHKLGDVTVGMVIGGMRGLKAMQWDASVLDGNSGIRFYGLTIKECLERLPKGKTGTEILPESMLWFLLTKQIPTDAQVHALSRDLAQQGDLPTHTKAILSAMPKTLHPMTQMSIAVASLNHDSAFEKAYSAGALKKADYWEPAFEDTISTIAKLPTIAATIYQNVHGVDTSLKLNTEVDLCTNLANMLGWKDDGFVDLLRLYIAIHGDHEGGNVSAHTSHLVGSALSDPMLSYSAALLGLAGPLHGLAAQEALRFVLQMQESIPRDFSKEDIEKYLWTKLNNGQVIPGYGHGVLRVFDPRFETLQDWAATKPDIAGNDSFRLVRMLSETAPAVLKTHGKTKNPYPNVDATSGVLLYHYGLTDFNFYTVIFGVSRALGCLTQYVWSRALGLPIERPKSLSIDDLYKEIQK